MFVQITTLLTQIRDELKNAARMRQEWVDLQTTWREEDVQRQVAHLDSLRKHEQEIIDLLQRSMDEAKAYAQERDAMQTRIMQENLTVLQERLAIEKALNQAAQPIDKQAIYNEMERERKARARSNKKSVKTEEITTDEAV